MKIVKELSRGKSINEKKYCIRGLEQTTPKEADASAFIKMSAYITVLEEHNSQWQSGTSSPNRIARGYRDAAAKLCQHEAAKTGRQDAIAARSIWESSKKTKKASSSSGKRSSKARAGMAQPIRILQ